MSTSCAVANGGITLNNIGYFLHYDRRIFSISHLPSLFCFVANGFSRRTAVSCSCLFSNSSLACISFISNPLYYSNRLVHFGWAIDGTLFSHRCCQTQAFCELSFQDVLFLFYVHNFMKQINKKYQLKHLEYATDQNLTTHCQAFLKMHVKCEIFFLLLIHQSCSHSTTQMSLSYRSLTDPVFIDVSLFTTCSQSFFLDSGQPLLNWHTDCWAQAVRRTTVVVLIVARICVIVIWKSYENETPLI